MPCHSCAVDWELVMHHISMKLSQVYVYATDKASTITYRLMHYYVNIYTCKFAIGTTKQRN